MAKVFRKGRFNFFKGKGWGQYVLYIFLEMLLVVAGILIALEINNANERAKNSDKALAIMHELRRDLHQNLEDMEGVIASLEVKDSLITRIMRDSVKPEDYRNQPAYWGLVMTYVTMNFQDNGFGSLIRQSELFSRDYDSLFTDLEKLYEDQYGLVESMQDRLGDFVIGTLERWSVEKTWLHKLSQGDISEEAIVFFSSSPYYRNTVDIYRTYASINMLPALREAKLRTILALVSLNRILAPQQDAWEEFEAYIIPTRLAHWNRDTGTYRMGALLEFDLSLRGKQLLMGRPGQAKFEVYPRNDSTLFLARGDLKIVIRHQAAEMRILRGAQVQTLKKVDHGRKFP